MNNCSQKSWFIRYKQDEGTNTEPGNSQLCSQHLTNPEPSYFGLQSHVLIFFKYFTEPSFRKGQFLKSSLSLTLQGTTTTKK